MRRLVVQFLLLALTLYCSIAQLVEPATVNRVVPGSSPGGTAKKSDFRESFNNLASLSVCYNFRISDFLLFLILYFN